MTPGTGVTHEAAPTRPRTLWDEGREPGRAVVAFGMAFALTVAVLDRSIDGHVSALFDLCFVMLCVALALAVRPGDFFTVGVLPPLLMAGVFVLFAIGHPGAIAHRGDGFAQALVTGLGRHSLALVVGYLLTLACLAIRHHRDLGADVIPAER